ncbi:MAG: hypothetical protein ABI169_09725 [Chitinophagaceae bacterium]
MTDKFKTVSLDTMIDKHIGERGTEKRDAFENELSIDLLGQAIEQADAALDPSESARIGRLAKSEDFED